MRRTSLLVIVAVVCAVLAAIALSLQSRRNDSARAPTPPATSGADAPVSASAVSGPTGHDALAPLIVGPMSREEIRSVINRNLQRFMACFELAPPDSPAIGGKVSIHFTINPAGDVVDATSADSTVGKSPVANCVLETMQSIKFPAPRGGGTVQVTYPFVFRPAR